MKGSATDVLKGSVVEWWRENLKQGNNTSHSLSSSKCVSMPSAPGTEQMSRAFRNVLHLLTRQQCPPSSFCGGKKHSSQRSSCTGTIPPSSTSSCLKQTNCIGCVFSAWPIYTGGHTTSTAEVEIQALGKWFMGCNSTHFMESKMICRAGRHMFGTVLLEH